MSLDAADMDRDGDLDVVVGEHNLEKPETAKMLIFKNHDPASGPWKKQIVSVGNEHHDGAVVADIDNDGKTTTILCGL